MVLSHYLDKNLDHIFTRYRLVKYPISEIFSCQSPFCAFGLNRLYFCKIGHVIINYIHVIISPSILSYLCHILSVAFIYYERVNYWL